MLVRTSPRITLFEILVNFSSKYCFTRVARAVMCWQLRNLNGIAGAIIRYGTIRRWNCDNFVSLIFRRIFMNMIELLIIALGFSLTIYSSVDCYSNDTNLDEYEFRDLNRLEEEIQVAFLERVALALLWISAVIILTILYYTNCLAACNHKNQIEYEYIWRI